MRVRATASLVSKLKKKAKNAAKSGWLSHNQALENLAREHGFTSWRELAVAASRGRSVASVPASTANPQHATAAHGSASVGSGGSGGPMAFESAFGSGSSPRIDASAQGEGVEYYPDPGHYDFDDFPRPEEDEEAPPEDFGDPDEPRSLYIPVMAIDAAFVADAVTANDILDRVLPGERQELRRTCQRIVSDLEYGYERHDDEEAAKKLGEIKRACEKIGTEHAARTARSLDICRAEGYDVLSNPRCSCLLVRYHRTYVVHKEGIKFPSYVLQADGERAYSCRECGETPKTWKKPDWWLDRVRSIWKEHEPWRQAQASSLTINS